MKTPRADRFKVLQASDSLRELAESKKIDHLIDAADVAHAEPDQVDDLFAEGIRIGLMMAATGQRTAVEIPICDGCAVFVGTPRKVRAKVADLPDEEPEEQPEEQPGK